MRYGLFGTTGLRVAEFFLGAMTFGEQGGVGAPAEECAKILDAYADAGGNVVDTAINYRGGQSEAILGELLEGRRDKFVLATKYVISRDPSDPNAAGAHRKNLRLSLETSLRRLRTDYIDIYWVHAWDRHTPVEETLRALDDAVTAGKILYIGISDTPSWIVSRANTLAELRGWTSFAGIQVPYSLLQRDIERELLPMAEAYGLSVAAWSPLANGILSGKYTLPPPQPSTRPAADATRPGADTRPPPQPSTTPPPQPSTRATRFTADSLSEHDHAVARVVQEVADELGVSSAQVALAWTRIHSTAVHPIVGARHLDQLVDNLAAVDLSLPAEAIEKLEAATGFQVGFPTDFLAGAHTFIYGDTADRLDGRSGRTL